MADSAVCQYLISNRDKIIGRRHVMKRENRTGAENGELAVAEPSCNWRGVEIGKNDGDDAKFGTVG